MRARSLCVSLLLTAAMAGGCKGRNCDSESDADKRDWCFYEAATRVQGGGQQIELISTDIGQIQSPMVRSFAVQKVLATSPDQFSQQQAEQLCGALSDPQRQQCLKNWSRPHLWTTN